MNYLKISLITLTLLAFNFSSCKKKDDKPKDETPVTTPAIQEGNWKITLYNDSGTDETYHFTSYTFTFSSNGTVSAVKSSSTVNGTWSKGTDDGKEKLYLSFGSTSPFEKLNDDWHILESTATKMRLEDVSGGNGGTDLLTFEKN